MCIRDRLMFMAVQTYAQEIVGNVCEAKTNVPVIGATIEIEGDKPVAVSDIDGNFTITDLKEGHYNLIIRYVGFRPKKIDGVQTQAPGAGKVVKIALETDEQQLQEVSVTGLADVYKRQSAHIARGLTPDGQGAGRKDKPVSLAHLRAPEAT